MLRKFSQFYTAFSNSQCALLMAMENGHACSVSLVTILYFEEQQNNMCSSIFVPEEVSQISFDLIQKCVTPRPQKNDFNV